MGGKEVREKKIGTGGGRLEGAAPRRGPPGGLFEASLLAARGPSGPRLTPRLSPRQEGTRSGK